MNDYNRGALPVPCLRLNYGFGEQWASVELGDGTGYVRLADYEKVESENAKLRELVRDVWEWELHGCDACNLIETAECDTDIYSEDCSMRAAVIDRMRELRIEVTDA